MANNDVQETLDRLLEELKSDHSERCLHAIQELSELGYSSEAIVLQLERLALKGEADSTKSSARSPVVQNKSICCITTFTTQKVLPQLDPERN